MGMPIPDAIKNAPRLSVGLELYWEAFFELNTTRPAGWGVHPIPWNSIRDYAEAYEFSDEQTASLFHHIRNMDQVFRDHHSKKKD